MKIYSINGRLYRFAEGHQPEGAVEYKPAKEKPVEVKKETETKAVKKPANKSKGVSNK